MKFNFTAQTESEITDVRSIAIALKNGYLMSHTNTRIRFISADGVQLGEYILNKSRFHLDQTISFELPLDQLNAKGKVSVELSSEIPIPNYQAKLIYLNGTDTTLQLAG